MTQQRPSETLNQQLVATIERHRRIICDLLVKNQALRNRLMQLENKADLSSSRRGLHSGIEDERKSLPRREVFVATISEALASNRLEQPRYPGHARECPGCEPSHCSIRQELLVVPHL
jgi:hypothetical protein